MKTVWRRLGPSGQAVSKLAGGTVVAQILLLAISPILTRLYTPAEFGVLASFSAMTTWLVTVAAGRYELAIVLPEEEAKAVRLALLSAILTGITSLLTLIGVAIALFALRDNPDSHLWLIWVPIATLVIGLNSILINFATRLANYGLIASTSVVRSGTIAALQILGGLVAPSAFTLTGANTIGSVAANVRLSRQLLSARRGVSTSRRELASVAREFAQFPKHTLPASLLSATSLSGLPLLIGAVFGATTLGLWSLAFRVLGTPLTVVGGAVSRVYYRRAVDIRNANGDSMRLFRSTTTKLLLSSLPIFVAIGLASPWLFGFVFGEEWSQAGTYAQIMIPWLWVRFATSPVSQTPLVFGKNSVGLIVQSLLFLVLATCSLASLWLGLGFATFLVLLSIASALTYVGALLLYARTIAQTPPTTAVSPEPGDL